MRNYTNNNKQWLITWVPLAIGFIILFAPTYESLVNGLWKTQDQGHGPIILMVILYLFWNGKQEIFLNESKPSPILGYFLFILGLFCYLIGRSQDVYILDIGSQSLIVAGVLLIFNGWSSLKSAWFPLFFLLFMIPLPGIIIDAVTLPMKIAVSYVTENILYMFDYPIARSGVMIYIGQYQLLVADACAGMHTLISLEALGLLYLNLVKHDSAIRNISLALLIIPIAFTSNVIRVIALTLITFYFGDEVGQGFVHGFAGMVLFIVALTLIMSIDNLIQWFVTKDKKSRHHELGVLNS